MHIVKINKIGPNYFFLFYFAFFYYCVLCFFSFFVRNQSSTITRVDFLQINRPIPGCNKSDFMVVSRFEAFCRLFVNACVDTKTRINEGHHSNFFFCFIFQFFQFSFVFTCHISVLKLCDHSAKLLIAAARRDDTGTMTTRQTTIILRTIWRKFICLYTCRDTHLIWRPAGGRVMML